MNSNSSFIVLLVASVLSLPGCGRKNPVNEVTVSQSGIEIVDNVVHSINEGDWASWRGPTGDGIATDQDPPIGWDETTNVLWRADVPGRGHSSPIVVGGSIFLATAEDQAQEQRVLSFSAEDGTQRWSTVIHQGNFPSNREIHKKGTNANGTIACDGSRLFIGMLNSDAIMATALDLDGEILWQKEVGKFVSKFGYAPSPVLYKSLVIFAADNMGGGYITAVDAATGDIAWRISRGNASSYSTPLVRTIGGRDQLVISGGDAVTSYDPASGSELWRTECIAEATCGTAVTVGDRIFASGGYPDQETVCLSADGKLLWSNETKFYEPSMVVSGDSLVGVNDGGIAFCWSAESGELRWKKRLGGNFSGSPVVCGDRIYASNLDGQTFVFQAGEKYEQIAKNKLGDDCYASPAVANNRLYLRIGVGRDRDRQEQLVCIGASEAVATE